MNVLSTILFYVIMLVVILALYAGCRLYVFNKIRINKWIPLAISIILFCCQLFIKGINGYVNAAINSSDSIIFTMVYGNTTDRWS